MKTKTTSLGLALVGMLIMCWPTLEGQRRDMLPNDHIEWVGQALNEMETIKVGMKRKDLLKVFMPDGGLNSGRTFIYRNCPYFKVDVEFQQENILRISAPYLARPVLD